MGVVNTGSRGKTILVCSFWGLQGVLSVVIPGRPGIVDYSETSMEPQYYKTPAKSLV